MDRKNAFTLVELLIVITVFVITFVLLTPFVNKIRERAHIIRCANHISMISLALHTYAADNNGSFPQSLSGLYPRYIKEERVFDCPASGSAGTFEKPDYEYVSNLTESSDPTEVIVYDRDGNHGNLGRNLLRVGGSVEWVRSTEGKPR